jgi:exopolyphosphatase / guanosine-5'-triphosphate,3'-diphosphate pyrophosphatase
MAPAPAGHWAETPAPPRIAATIRFHRKQLPSTRHPELAALRRADRESVCTMSLLLRLAERLDRSRSGCVRAARLSRNGRQAVVIELEMVGDCHLELWGSGQRKEAVERALGHSLVVRHRVVVFGLFHDADKGG